MGKFQQGASRFESLPLCHRSGTAFTPPKKLAIPKNFLKLLKKFYKKIMKRLNLLLALSITLGTILPAQGYVMVRSGFGELKQDRIDDMRQERGHLPSWEVNEVDDRFDDPNSLVFENASVILRNNDCTSGSFECKGCYNLSVALGRRFNVFDTGALGIEIEILGAYAHFNKRRHSINDLAPYALLPRIDNIALGDISVPMPDFIAVQYRNTSSNIQIANVIPMYLKNQRIVGAQANIYWEQYILDWLSAGIGGGIGGAYVCTKFTTLEQCFLLERRILGQDENGNDLFRLFWNYGAQEMKQGRKYAHSGALLYNFMCFVRAEKFETLFEVGYRHIGLHQIFDNKIYGGLTIKKLADMHSDQIYFGIGRTF